MPGGAEIARFVGQRKLSLTADTYTHVLADGREVNLAKLLALQRLDVNSGGVS
jgi:hypothetical protein